MEFTQRIFLYLAIAAGVCLVAGLFKPWMMLWWADTQNRKKVIKLYGTVAVITFTIYWILSLL